MYHRIINLISAQYKFETKSELRRLIGLNIIIVIGLVTGLVLFFSDLLDWTQDQCLVGDISMLIVFGIAAYGLRSRRIDWVVNTVFLIPFVVYFFYISKPVSPYPVYQTVPYSLWILAFCFFFLLIYGESKKQMSFFYIVSVITLIIHLFSGDIVSYLFLFSWPTEELVMNPILVISLVYITAMLVMWNYQNYIFELREKLEDNRHRASQSARQLPFGLLVMRIEDDDFENPMNLNIIKTNNAFERMFKTPAREIRGRDIESTFPVLFRGAFDWHHEFFLARKKRFEFYVEHLDKWFEAFILKPELGELICLFHDVSPKQRMITKLEESRQRFQVLLEAIPDLFFIIDKDGVYMDFVFKESESMRIKPEDIVGNSIFEVGFSERMSNKIYQCIQQCIEFDSIETIEYALEIENGTAMFEMRIARLNEESVITIARDITKRKMAEIRLEEAKNKAEESDRLKTAFLANISHEIRTPMNAIIGFSKLIGSPEFEEEERNKFIEIIISNGRLLLELINDMISLSKIESSLIVVKRSLCKVNDLMVQLYKDFSYDVVSNGKVKLKVNCENANPKFSMMIDQTLLKETLEKLVDNAIKFTDRGEVEFGYRQITNNMIEFFVKDTGIGILEKDIPKIFERFHQLDNRTSRDYEGTGLGLSIARHYVSLMDGELKVESEFGKGSRFFFVLPFEKGEGHLKVIR